MTGADKTREEEHGGSIIITGVINRFETMLTVSCETGYIIYMMNG